MWYQKTIGGGRCPIVDTWWQTETGAIMITPLPGVTTLKPGSATRPFPGVEAAVYSESGEEVGPGGGGYLVLRRPWPAMLRGIYKDDERYKETYWSKYPDTYFAGDGARIDEDGDFWLLGRVDDVIYAAELPKTRSGKIMRRLLRDVAENRPLGDTTTLADPTVVEEIKSRAEAEKSEEN